MRLVVATTLPAGAEQVREHVMTSRLMRHVSWPLALFSPLSPPELPEVWDTGDYRVRMRSLWVVPLGEQIVSISFPTGANGEFMMRDNGHGQMVKRWDHVIRIVPSADGQATLYRDEVEVEAGPLTLPVWAWANFLFRWRQDRWRRLARRGFSYR